MKKQIRRVFAVLLAMVLVTGTLPYSANADANRNTDTSYRTANTMVGEEADALSTDSSNNSEQADFANRPLSTGSNADPTNPEGTSTTSSSTDANEMPQNEGEGLAELSVYAQEKESTDGTATKAAKTTQARANNNAGDFNVTGDSGWIYDGVFTKWIRITKSGTYTITGDGSEHEGCCIQINGGINVNLTLKDVKIRCALYAAMGIEGTATVTLNLEGDNSLTSTGDKLAGVEFCAQSGSLTITSTTNGSLTAKGGANAAGIGGGLNGTARNITISGGTVNATGGSSGAGIGGGFTGGASNITISGGTVIANGGDYGAGVGGGLYGSASNITISGGIVNATGGLFGGAGIGGGSDGNGNDISISGGTVTATGNGGAGIGGGDNGSGSNIEISGGNIIATGDGAGIGGGYYDGTDNNYGSNITISGGTVIATGGPNSAGIGGGPRGSANNITISGGTVTAKGSSSNAAGIGSGHGGDASASDIKISNGSVKASSITITPTKDGISNVYLCAIPDLSGVNSVTVGSDTYTRNGDHPEGDGTFYLYLTGRNHAITANGVNYYAIWDSDSSTFKVYTQNTNASFSATGEDSGTLSNVDTSMQYSVDNGANWIDITGDMMEITGVTAANGVQVKRPGSGLIPASEVQTINVTQPAQPTVSGVGCTTAKQDDGQIINVNNSMEYRQSGSSDWMVIEDTVVKGLDPGIYEVRIKANGTQLASSAATITIDSHTCVAQGGWQSDETSHWKLCSCEEKVDVASHMWNNGVCTVCRYVCQHKGGEASYFAQAVCDICGSEYGSLAVDGTAPTGEIKVSGNTWDSLQSTTDRKLYFDGAQQVEIAASDDSYSHKGFTDDKGVKIEYYLHSGDTALTEDELNEVGFTAYDGSFSIEPDNSYVIYAKITDHAGNITYISSDAIVLDGTAPTGLTLDANGYSSGEWLNSGDVTLSVSGAQALSGIAKYQYSTDNGSSWTDMTIANDSASLVISDETIGTDYIFRAVSNAGLASEIEAVTVRIDRTAPDGDIKFDENSVKKFINQITFNLLFNKDVDVTTTGTDNLSGVSKIEYYRSDRALTEQEVRALAGWTETDGTFSVTAEDKAQFIYYVRVTDNAGNVTYFGSDGATFDLTPPVISGITDGGVYYVSHEVTVSDEYPGTIMLNDAETTGSTFTITGDVDQIYKIVAADEVGNVTKYTVTMKPIASLEERIAGLTVDNVTSDDKENVKAVKDEIDTMDTSAATEDEKAALQEIGSNCDQLLAKIDETAHAIETPSIQEVADVTSDNVALEDKDNLQAAKDDLEQALEDYAGNLTEEEKAAIEEDIERIDNALTSIEKAEAVEDAIDSLPDAVEPDDTDAEQIINDAKGRYGTLTEHEKSLISEEATEKLERLLNELVDYRIVEGDGSRWEKGTETGLSFTANGAYTKFTGIEVDGRAVNQTDYTVASGSTKITLKPEYLETLSVGKHSLTVQYTDGEVSCGFEVCAEDSVNLPQTSDGSNIGLCAVSALAAGVVLIGVMLYCRRKKCSR